MTLMMKPFTPLLRNKKTKSLKKRNSLLKNNHKNKKGKNQTKKKGKKFPLILFPTQVNPKKSSLQSSAKTHPPGGPSDSTE